MGSEYMTESSTPGSWMEIPLMAIHNCVPTCTEGLLDAISHGALSCWSPFTRFRRQLSAESSAYYFNFSVFRPFFFSQPSFQSD